MGTCLLVGLHSSFLKWPSDPCFWSLKVVMWDRVIDKLLNPAGRWWLDSRLFLILVLIASGFLANLSSHLWSPPLLRLLLQGVLSSYLSARVSFPWYSFPKQLCWPNTKDFLAHPPPIWVKYYSISCMSVFNFQFTCWYGLLQCEFYKEIWDLRNHAYLVPCYLWYLARFMAYTYYIFAV